jgi:predicted protein tyrosine phosphatase
MIAAVTRKETYLAMCTCDGCCDAEQYRMPCVGGGRTTPRRQSVSIVTYLQYYLARTTVLGPAYTPRVAASLVLLVSCNVSQCVDKVENLILRSIISELGKSETKNERMQAIAQLSVGTLVLLDGERAGECAVVNDDGSWDIILDDGTDVDAVPPSRLSIAAVQRVRPQQLQPTLPSELEAAAMMLRLGLLENSLGGDDSASRHMACVLPADPASGRGALFLGDKIAAETHEWLAARAIAAVVNVTENLPNCHEGGGIEYHALCCEDAEEAAETLDRALDITLEVMQRWLAAGRNVLVHCRAGRSRSATVVLAHMMRSHRVGLVEALERVLQARAVLPNRGFYRVLVDRQADWWSRSVDAAAPTPPHPDYEALAQRFVAELHETAVRLQERARHGI